VWNPDEKRTDDSRAGWQEVPDSETYPNGFRPAMGECSSVTSSKMRHGIIRCYEGAKGVQLAELALDELEATGVDGRAPPLSLAGERTSVRRWAHAV
jgi:hypothetical protein